MDRAILTFDGIASLTGRVETTEGYFHFRTYAVLSTAQLNELHRATIKIDGRAESVLVEGTDWLQSASPQEEQTTGFWLTLRRKIESSGPVEDETSPHNMRTDFHQTPYGSRRNASYAEPNRSTSTQ